MFSVGPNDDLSRHFTKVGLLVAEKNVNTQTDTKDSCFISIDHGISKAAVNSPGKVSLLYSMKGV